MSINLFVFPPIVLLVITFSWSRTIVLQFDSTLSFMYYPTKLSGENSYAKDSLEL